jgi:diacylglycerol O-acyltransferase / wax synthase
MRQLTSLDAQFLALEDSRTTGHVGGLTVLDPSTTESGELELADIQQLIEERLPLLPPLRWRLAEVPFGLDYPYWIDDPDFDLDFHVRELGMPAKAGDEQLAGQVARIMARPLDRARPLWEIYLIHGLPEGNMALLTKIHHSVIDGMSGAEIMGALFDLGPEGRKVPAPSSNGPERDPSDVEMLARGLMGVPRYPLRALRSLPRALPAIDEVPVFSALPGAKLVARVTEILKNTVTGETSTIGHTDLKAPKTSFNGRISPHRRFAFGRIPLEEVKAVKNARGCTVNDVVVAICAGAVRSWLIDHDELLPEPLVAQIPISVRTDEQMGTFGNRIMLMSAPLYTNEPNPLRRLQATHTALAAMKERHRALPAELLQDTNHFIPPAVFARAARASLALSTSSAGRPNWNLVISNVPGPQVPLYCAGAEIVANYPISVVTDGLGLNITVMSYCGEMDFGIVSDRDQIPDLDTMLDRLRASLEELKKA